MTNMFARFVKEESGATAIEYGLIASLIAVTLILVLTQTGESLQAVFSNISKKLDSTVK